MHYLALLLLLSLASFSQQATPDRAKKELAAAWKDTEERLIAVNPLTKSLLDEPLEKLKEPYKGGEKSVDDIYDFKGPGDKDKATDNAVAFWKEKMEEVIKPFVDNAEDYKFLSADKAGPIPEPNYERTDEYEHEYEYVAAEEEINGTVAEAEETLMKEYERVTGKAPGTADKVAKVGWKKVAGKWPLVSTLEMIRIQGLSSKHDVGNGNYKLGMDRLNWFIGDWSAEFYKKMKAIESA